MNCNTETNLPSVFHDKELAEHFGIKTHIGKFKIIGVSEVSDVALEGTRNIVKLSNIPCLDNVRIESIYEANPVKIPNCKTKIVDVTDYGFQVGEMVVATYVTEKL